jgi:hypothetical protein
MVPTYRLIFIMLKYIKVRACFCDLITSNLTLKLVGKMNKLFKK